MKYINYIYLAGKIAPPRVDWRRHIIDYRLLNWEEGYEKGGVDQVEYWPVRMKAIFDRFDYVGPFFIECGHTCFFGANEHGVGAHSGGEFSSGHYDDKLLTMEATKRRCLNAIQDADLLFAWIDNPTCYGTIAEIGYARALGKTIWIAGPERFADLWFVYEMADKHRFSLEYHDQPHLLLDEMIDREIDRKQTYKFDSPIEESFWNAWSKSFQSDFKLIPQHPIGKYRVDFAHASSKTVIELDGFASHSSTEDIANDRKRQRWLEEQGWYVIRFGGKEISSDAAHCAEETWQILARRQKEA